MAPPHPSQNDPNWVRYGCLDRCYGEIKADEQPVLDCGLCEKKFHTRCANSLGWDLNREYKAQWICGNCFKAREGGMRDQKTILLSAAVVRRAGEGVQRWICGMCSKEADLWCDWPTCKRRKDGEDPKPFTTKSNLKQHKKGHTREGLPECHLCTKKYFHQKDADKCVERCRENMQQYTNRSRVIRTGGGRGRGRAPAPSGHPLLPAPATSSALAASPAGDASSSDGKSHR